MLLRLFTEVQHNDHYSSIKSEVILTSISTLFFILDSTSPSLLTYLGIQTQTISPKFQPTMSLNL